MYSSSERFKPAGHKAQELSEIVMPEEVFKPIQRVVEKSTEMTIGYLYREIEHRQGEIGDVVLSAGVLLDVHKNARLHNAEGWREYEQNDEENSFKWTMPSGPLTTELIYRTQRENRLVRKEANNTWNTTLHYLCLITSTIINYKDGISQIRHNWNESPVTTIIPEELKTIITDNNSPNTQQFLQALLGKRHALTQRMFGQYATSVMLWRTVEGRHALALGIGNDNRHYILANDICSRPARGISLLANFPSPQYEVRDD